MNIRRYICGGLSVILALSMFCLPAWAENNEISINITDLEVGAVEVTGQALKAGYTINLLVLKKTENPDATEIQYQQETISDENGEFRFNFKVYNKNEFDEGWYNVYVGGDGFDGVETGEFYFASSSSKKAAIAEINSAANNDDTDFNQIYKGFSDMFDLKSLAIEGINENNMYKLLRAYVKKNNFEETDFAKVKDVFRIYNILEAYTEALACVKADGKLIMLEELGIDTSKEDVIYDIYNELSSDGVDALLKGLKDKEYADVETFEKVLREQIVVAAILNPQKGGTGHIREILSDEVCEELGINISDYKNSKYKTEIEAELLKSSFTDAKSLEGKIKDITESIKKKFSGTSGKGGSGSGGGSTVVIPTQNASGDYIEEEKKIRDNTFSDVEVAHWAYPAIEQLYERGIINGVSDDKYSPDAYVTREQIAKIVCTMLGLEGADNNAGFSDVETTRWSAGFINVCKNKGYIMGYPDNTFAPEGYVTRQDIAVILSRVLDSYEDNTVELQFSDSDNISDYAVEAVKNFIQKGIIKGYDDNSFKPKKNCTRAEVAAIVYACIKEMEGDI